MQGIQLAYSLLPEISRGKIFLNVRDSSDSILIEKTLNDLARNPKTVGVLGPLLSGEIKRSMVIADSFKLPIFTPTASSADLVDLSPYIFRNAFPTTISAIELSSAEATEIETFDIEWRYQHFEPSGVSF